MKTALLDLNILTALLWPAHEHHVIAHSWFHRRGNERWASCPLTQLGVVRLLTNPAFSRDALSPASAIDLLAQNLKHPRHEFWSETQPVPRAIHGLTLQGYKQLTDAYLLTLARQHKGVLATFDRGLRSLAAAELEDFVEVVATS